MHAELRAGMIEWRGPKIEPLFCGIYQEIAINRVLDPDIIKLMVKSTEKVGGLRKNGFRCVWRARSAGWCR